MPDPHHLLLFVIAGVVLNLTPGPDVLFIVTHALRRGVRTGLVAALGITAGCCVHIVAAAVGVSALVAASSTAFAVLKWVGAAYLVWVGIGMLRLHDGRDASNLIASPVGRTGAAADFRLQNSPWAVLRRGFWTNALNPKVALFFLAFVPQFIAPQVAHPSLVFLALGLLFNVNALLVNAGWALAAGWMGRRVGVVQTTLRWLERAAGVLFIGFGLKLALSDAPGVSSRA